MRKYYCSFFTILGLALGMVMLVSSCGHLSNGSQSAATATQPSATAPSPTKESSDAECLTVAVPSALLRKKQNSLLPLTLLPGFMEPVYCWQILSRTVVFAYEGIKGLGVVFSDIEFNAIGIKGKHLSQGRINGLAEGLSKIDELMEHIFNKRKKVLFEACKQRCVRNLLEAAENPKFLAKIKKKVQQGARGDGKERLKDECSPKAGKRVNAFTAQEDKS